MSEEHPVRLIDHWFTFMYIDSYGVNTIECVVYNGVHVEWIMLSLYLVEVLKLVG